MAGIIKAGKMERPATGLQSTAFNFEDLSERANDYLAVVRRQAEQLLQNARAEATQIAAAAKAEGRQAALVEAQRSLGATLDQQLATLLPALQQAVQDIRHSKALWLTHWESQIITLATTIAERVIRREVANAPEITIDLIRDALELSMGSGTVTIQLNPQDYEALRDRTQDLAKQIGKLGATNLVADPEISPGGCRVVTEFGVVDQTFEAQLARIAEELACNE
ncbi:MAG: flagellar assembly protein FliH [Planctomycetaceae bacterium]|nr:flagellar assembly protein FliH [Planctomycetales bacterium]MCB9924780.1 flagellar assembly protein FliH [Planctomycetaceae bacterium]